MTRPRSALVSLETTPYYHCISRCVRRAFLMGHDRHGNSFDHRKQWLEERIRLLGDIFAVDIAAYAVMSNHYHLVLHIDKARADNWSDDEVQQRWHRLFRGSELLRRKMQGALIMDYEAQELRRLTTVWRERLANLSWFMSSLNYVIALRANKEDGCTGRFWEGRFKSQALKDEAALLACMAYVDLNPVRAGMADSLAHSDFTSIQARLHHLTHGSADTAGKPRLMPFGEGPQKEARISAVVPFRFRDYVELVNWYGQARHLSKRGRLDEARPRLLQQLGLSAKRWDLLSREIQKESSTMMDGLEKAIQLERRLHKAAKAAA